jgi:hypothetical protein
MRPILKNALGLGLIATVLYLLSQKKSKQQQHSGNKNASTNLNVDATTNANVNRSQQSPLVVDRLPLVEETTTIVPANEIVAMNYKGCQLNSVEKELYTNDAPLFREKAEPLVQLDVNAGQRRINYTFSKVSQNPHF